MEITINVPDNLPKDILTRRIQEIEETLKKEAQTAAKSKELSRWAKISKKIRSDPKLNLQGYSKQLKSDIKEFRANLEFSHDK